MQLDNCAAIAQHWEDLEGDELKDLGGTCALKFPS